jgi:hypothetical protein
LSAIGKKGIIAVARSYSEETFVENKSLFLDLIGTIIIKMNGDVKKFMKLCGSAYLTSKARDSIEKRVAKKAKVEPSKSTKRPSRASISSRRSLAPPAPGSNNRDVKEYASPMKKERAHSKKAVSSRIVNDENDGPFKFSYSASENNKGHIGHHEESTKATAHSGSTLSHELSTKREANSGAAASLRQRLRQIRDRHQPEQYISTSPIPPSVQFSSSRELSPTPPSPDTLLRSIMEDIDNLLSQPIPLGKKYREVFSSFGWTQKITCFFDQWLDR